MSDEMPWPINRTEMSWLAWAGLGKSGEQSRHRIWQAAGAADQFGMEVTRHWEFLMVHILSKDEHPEIGLGADHECAGFPYGGKWWNSLPSAVLRRAVGIGAVAPAAPFVEEVVPVQVRIRPMGGGGHAIGQGDGGIAES